MLANASLALCERTKRSDRPLPVMTALRLAVDFAVDFEEVSAAALEDMRLLYGAVEVKAKLYRREDDLTALRDLLEPLFPAFFTSLPSLLCFSKAST